MRPAKFIFLWLMLFCAWHFQAHADNVSLPAPTYVTEWGTHGTGPGAFNGIGQIAFGSGSRLYVADRENRRIQVFATDSLSDSIPQVGSIPFSVSPYGTPQGPTGLAVFGDTVFACGAGFIREYAPGDTSAILEWKASRFGGSIPGGVSSMIAVDSSYIYIPINDSTGTSPYGDGKLLRMRRNGTFGSAVTVHTSSAPDDFFAQFYAIASDCQGNVYLDYVTADSVGQFGSFALKEEEIKVISPTGGVLLKHSFGNSFGGPLNVAVGGMAVDAAGMIYYVGDNDRHVRVVADETETGLSFDASASSRGGLQLPVGLAADSLGNIFISDRGSFGPERVIKANVDHDGDDIPDSWEKYGLAGRVPGSRLTLPDSHVLAKDIYVEVDRARGTVLDSAAVQKVIDSFGSASPSFLASPNPSGAGLHLHVQFDPETFDSTDTLADYATDAQFFGRAAFLKGKHFGTTSERNDGLVLAKRMVYHYCLSDDHCEAPGGGYGELRGDDCLVLTKQLRDSTGTVDPDDVAAMFMHELGHNLGLDHGGTDAINNKPNYHSVMNYIWNTRPTLNSAWAKGFRIGYNDHDIPTLAEICLNENNGINDRTVLNGKYLIPVGPILCQADSFPHIGNNYAPASGRVDWSKSHTKLNSLWLECVQRDLTHWGGPLGPVKCTYTNTGYDTLRSPIDWSNLVYFPRVRRFGTDPLRYKVDFAPGPGGMDPASEPTHLQFLAAKYAIADCNGNGIDDYTDITSGRSLDVNHNLIPDECEPTRVEGLRDSVVLCPGGDADSVAWHVDFADVYIPGSCCSVWAIVDSLGPGLSFWTESGSRIGRGSRINAYSIVDDDSTGEPEAYFVLRRASGCGVVRFSVYSQDSVVVRGLSCFVRSVDQDSAAYGGVDRFDLAALGAKLVAHVPDDCWDLNGTGGPIDGLDLNFLSAHYGCHVPRVLFGPESGERYSLGDTLRIRWRQGIGTQADVTLRAIRLASADTITIVSDQPDSGSYDWPLPSTTVAGTYLLQVLHSAGSYVADYHDVGIAFGDSTVGVRPIAIAQPTTTRGKHSWTLSWEDASQNGAVIPDSLAVRYHATASIDEENWGSCTVEPPDAAAGEGGTPHCVESDSAMLTPHTYYFGVKEKIDGVWSLLSPLVSATTGGPNQEVFCTIYGLMAGGDDGGGMLRARPLNTTEGTGTPAVSSDMDEFPAENSVLGWDPSAVMRDTYHVQLDSYGASDSYQLRYRQLARHQMEIDRVGLAYCDHAPDVSAYAVDGEVLTGHVSALPVAWDGDDGRTTTFATVSVDSPLVAGPGDGLVVKLAELVGSRVIVIRARATANRASTDSSGILVEVASAAVGWEPIGLVHLRSGIDECALKLPAATLVRLQCYSQCEISGVGELAVENTTVLLPLALELAEHSRVGDVRAAIADEGGGVVDLSLGDTLRVAFASTGLQSGMVRDVFLTTVGQCSGLGVGDTASASSGALVIAPTWRTALGYARPNPSNSNFSIDYTLATQGAVIMQVFDVAGRLVRTLLNTTVQAGPHTVVWDGSAEDGRRVGPSVYFYRMRAGGFLSQRKAVLLTR